MEHLGVAVVIDGRPRSHRPGIVKLPIKRTHVVRLRRAVRLNRDFHAIGLRKLAQIDIFLKVLGLDVRVITFDEVVNLARATGVFLVRRDDFGILAQTADDLQGRTPLHSMCHRCRAASRK